VSLLFAAVRALHFISLMTLFGAAAFMALLRAHRIGMPRENVARALFSMAAGLALVSGVFWFILVAGNMAGDWHAGFDRSTLRLVMLDTEFGHIALWRLAGLALLCVLCFGRVAGRIVIIAGISGLVLAGLGLTSHAAAAEGAHSILRAGNDALHLLTAGFWVGGLAVLAALMAEGFRQPQELVAPFRLFSRFGILAVALLVVSGIVNAASILPISAVSPKNIYADLLALKITMALSMIGLAGVNRMQLVPALGHANDSVVHQLGRSVKAEIVLGLLIVSLVGYLGQIAPG